MWGAAPTRLEVFGGVAKAVAGAASYAYNYGTWMTAGFVADRCRDVLVVCGERLDLAPAAQAESRARVRALNLRVIRASLKKSMQRLEKALRKDDVRLVVWVYNTMNDVVLLAKTWSKRVESSRR